MFLQLIAHHQFKHKAVHTEVTSRFRQAIEQSNLSFQLFHCQRYICFIVRILTFGTHSAFPFQVQIYQKALF